ncbi:MAG: hypothetical protein IT423_22065 [Pirellulaceae bacterium]|nr:hypothetical protein [Pirellulaceae bacterium]
MKLELPDAGPATSAGAGGRSVVPINILAIRRYIREQCPYANLLSDVVVDVDPSGGVRLSGTVRSYYLRQVLVAFVLKAASNVRVNDYLHVVDTSNLTGPESSN